MRFFRFILLNKYFLNNSQNKKKALRLINVGIFFTIFAISSAIITFVVEKNIADKEEELTYLQISVNETGKLISEFENLISIAEIFRDYEEDSMIDKELLANTNIGARVISQKDFYTPYLYILLKDIYATSKMYQNVEFDLFDENDEFYQLILESINNVWAEEDVKKFKDAMSNFFINYNKIKKIDYNEFDFKNITDYSEIVEDLKNWKKIDLLSDDFIIDYHQDVRDYDLSSIIFFKKFLKYMKSINYAEIDLIKDVNSEILTLSKNEKNIILITFIFQLIIFIIIQIFEINSFNINFKNKKK